MCFAIMKRRTRQYLQDPEQLKMDCLQIFTNAMSFHRPNTVIFKDAEKMYTLCLDKINRYLPYLNKQTAAQEKESLYTKLV